MKHHIPQINCGSNVASKSVDIIQAIESVGFVYLTDCGIEFDLVDQLNGEMNKFWKLPTAEKKRFSRGNFECDSDHGYVGENDEMLQRLNDPDYIHKKQSASEDSEIRESFNFHYHCSDECFPEKEIPGITELTRRFYDQCRTLALQIIAILAEKLCPQNSSALLKQHESIGKCNNGSMMRLLHYPPLPDHITAGTMRLADHTDYGSLTLLFQDAVGGLEVCDRDGQYQPAIPVPNAVLVNIGDLMQRWSNDRWKAVVRLRHRVLVPEDVRCWNDERQSIVLFVHPDAECVVQPFGVCANYPPVTAKQYLRMKNDTAY